jgi:hypothetical protein
MTKQDLIQFVTDELTVSGSLNISLKEKEIDRIIEAEKKYVFREWRDTVELRYGIIPVESFRSQQFKSSRTVQMPDCVWGIYEFREIKDSARLFGINDPDLNFDRVMNSDLYLAGPFMSDIITSRIVSYSFFDLARSFTVYDVGFNFNINTKRLKVIGHDPLNPVLINAYVQIEDSDLFDDYYFQRWIIARCKTQMHRLLKTFEYNLVGGVNITTMYGEQGKEEMQEIKEIIDKRNPPDWFIMFP